MAEIIRLRSDVSMSDGDPTDWNQIDNKRRAIIAVLKHIISKPPEVGENCVVDDDYVRDLFEDPTIGNITVPDDVKTVFMPTGELARKAKGSVVIELPPRKADGSGFVPGSDNDLLKFVLCCYNVWAPSANP